MSGESSQPRARLPRRTLGTIVLRNLPAENLSKFGRAWIAIHPDEAKPGLLLAQRIGCSKRHGDFIIRGDREPNPRAMLALNEAIID
jgi:hypothetical protein